MQARFMLGAGLLAILLGADQAEPGRYKTCREFLGLSDADQLVYARGLFEGYHAALIRASFFSDRPPGHDAPYPPTRSFSKFARFRSVPLSQIEELLEGSCKRDPSGQTPVPDAFLSVAQELESKGQRDEVPAPKQGDPTSKP